MQIIQNKSYEDEVGTDIEKWFYYDNPNRKKILSTKNIFQHFI